MELQRSPKLRTDIQALRGLAVLLVVLYHANLLPVHSGFLGVDIFFVISGFLITSQIAHKVSAGNFTFKEFYFRRAKRLLPAAYTVIFVTLLVAPIFLTTAEMGDFFEQVLGALTFTGNMVLWQQTGYFERAAELKPLLHTWSLAIEEQYYLLVPVLLYLGASRYWLLGMLMLTVASLTAYAWGVTTMPSAAFYLFPFRFWELGFGSVLALWMIRYGHRYRVSQLIGNLGLLVVVTIPLLKPANEYHVVQYSLAICLATAAVIAAKLQWVERFRGKIALSAIGSISYSWYLVHWPIFSYLEIANVSGGGLWWPFRVSAFVLSLVLAIALNILVENRFRYPSSRSSVAMQSIWLVTGAIILGILAASFDRDKGLSSHLTDPIYGLSTNCENLDFHELVECRTGPDPELLIWGDSYAMHWVSGLEQLSKVNMMQATRPTCAPVLYSALYKPPKYTREWSNNCIDFNSAVVDSLEHLPSIKTVVMSGLWAYLLNAQVLHRSEVGSKESNLEQHRLEQQLLSTISKVRGMGKKVVMIAPPPTSGFDIGRCMDRKIAARFYFGGSQDCQISREKYLERRQKLISFLANIQSEADIEVVSVDDELCNQTICETYREGIVLYKDAGHLSRAGATYIAEKMNLADGLINLAR